MVGGSKLLTFGDLLLEVAESSGFPVSGAVDLDLAVEAMAPHVARYDQWIADGNAGAMSYLLRGRDRRADPRLVFPSAQSILTVAIPYRKQAAGAPSPEEGPRFARYLEGSDYHERIAERLEATMKQVALRCLEQGLPAPTWKVCVDTSAVLERSWAVLAGLGWVGKNTLLIHPKLGSYFFLGSVLIDQPTGRGPTPLPDFCGHCTRCLDACPTSAFDAPHALDSRRCISYLTLEKRGEFEASDETLKKTGAWVAGCDICQEVCPFNRKPVKEAESLEEGSAPLELGPIAKQDWESLLAENEEDYRARVRGTALSRIKPREFRRNLLHALGNTLHSLPPEAGARLRHRLKESIESCSERETDLSLKDRWLVLLRSD